MKNPVYKSLPAKKLPKNDREHAVLMGLIELFLKTGKPIGSHTLQENGFESLSSATIRNYFSKMEARGLLKQQHTSGGRIPTEKAYRLYADEHKSAGHIEALQERNLADVFEKESREIASLIHRAAEALSEETKCAVFISTPRFDQDFIQDVRLLALDPTKLLAVLMTDFGLIRTETLYVEKPAAPPFLRAVEEYFLWRMNKAEKPLFADEAETKAAQRIYNEVMVRHVVGYANYLNEEIVRSGLSRLLAYPEFNDAAALSRSLSLLEDDAAMRGLLRECARSGPLRCWIGDELCPAVPAGSECAVVATPYRINQAAVGAVAVLGPMRLSYKNIFGLVQHFSEELSRKLTQSVYKFKISFRQPETGADRQIAHEKEMK
jgi:heat-inducible transcriptional repressor